MLKLRRSGQWRLKRRRASGQLTKRWHRKRRKRQLASGRLMWRQCASLQLSRRRCGSGQQRKRHALTRWHASEPLILKLEPASGLLGSRRRRTGRQRT